MEYVLKVSGVSKKYRSTRALSGCSVNIPRGSVYGIVGRNGSGKTTLIRLICGLQKPDEGSIEIFGTDINDRAIGKARRRMGAVIESPAVYLDMTARENLIQQYRMLGLPECDELDKILEMTGISDTGEKKAKTFSLGMKQRLGIAVALCGNPDFIVLDEPVNGLDPQGIVGIRELILKLNREMGITFLISSHILSELEKLATCYGIIDRGTVVKEITSEELERICRKCIRIRVTDTVILSEVFEKNGTEYEIVSDDTADIFNIGNLSQIMRELSDAGCDILSFEERNETLESYYISLTGGDRK